MRCVISRHAAKNVTGIFPVIKEHTVGVLRLICPEIIGGQYCRGCLVCGRRSLWFRWRRRRGRLWCWCGRLRGGGLELRQPFLGGHVIGVYPQHLFKAQDACIVVVKVPASHNQAVSSAGFSCNACLKKFWAAVLSPDLNACMPFCVKSVH